MCSDIYRHLALEGQASECTGKTRSSRKEPTHNITSAFPCLGGFSLPEMFPCDLPCDGNLFFYLVHNPVSLQTQPFSKAAQQGVPRIEPLSLVTTVRFSFSSMLSEKPVG